MNLKKYAIEILIILDWDKYQILEDEIEDKILFFDLLQMNFKQNSMKLIISSSTVIL